MMGISLLLAGALSSATLVLSRTLDRRIPIQAKADACVWIKGASWFYWFRFYLFPKHMFAYFYDGDVIEELGSLYNPILGTMGLIWLFNIVLSLDVASSTIARIK